MTRNDIIQDLKGLHELFLNTEFGTFYRKDLGRLSLAQLEPKIKTYLSKLEVINSYIESVKLIDLQGLASFFRQLHDKIISIKTLPENIYIKNHKENLRFFESMDETFIDIWGSVVAIIAYINTTQESDRIVNEFTVKRDELNKELSEAKTLTNAVKKQYETILKENEALDSKLMIVTQSDIFKQEADKNFYYSIAWLIGAVISIFIFFGVLYVMIKNFCFDLECYNINSLIEYNKVCPDCGKQLLWFEIFKSILFRILLISMCIYLITFCVKNYNAAMHNLTINKHRHNSFSAAFHFNNNTTNGNKDEILAKAAEAIFTYQKTGYYGKEGMPNNPNFTQEIINKVIPGSKE